MRTLLRAFTTVAILAACSAPGSRPAQDRAAADSTAHAGVDEDR